MSAPTIDPTTTLSTATVRSGQDGGQTVVWSIPLDVADAVMALVARDTRQQIAVGAHVDPRIEASLAPLSAAVVTGYDRMVEDVLGCLDTVAGETLSLTEGMVLCLDENTASVLLPGDVDVLDAVSDAVAILSEHATIFDVADPMLVADVSQPRWTVLTPCTNPAHSLHPEIAAHGAATEGSVVVTRVNFSR